MSIDDGPASVTTDDLTAWLSSAVERPDLIPEIAQTMAEMLPVEPPGYVVLSAGLMPNGMFSRIMGITYVWLLGIAVGIALLAYPWGMSPARLIGLAMVVGLGLLAPAYSIADTIRWYHEHPRPTLEDKA